MIQLKITYYIIHTEDDYPAIIYSNGNMVIWNGYLHRDNDQPAVIYPDGLMQYYKNGVEYTL